MHGVALPDGEVAGALDGGYVGGKVLADLTGAVAGDQGYLADFAVGVDDVEKADELVGGHAGADLDADGVGDAAEEFDMGAVELARAVADPEEVCGGGVVACCGLWSCGRWVAQEAGETLLVFEEETLVAGEDVDGLDASVCVDSDGVHKTQRVFDSVDDALVLLFD